MKETLKKVFTKHFRFPASAGLERVRRNFSPTEKLMFTFLGILLVVSAGSLLYKLNALFLTEIPAPGGELREGIIVSPRFVNTLLSLSDADRDLTTLIYSGLLRRTPSGKLVPALAERYELAEDGMSDPFRLRADATFHDGKTREASSSRFLR